MSYTVQHILQGKSGLPEDRYVNTFAFAWDGIGDEPDKETATDIITARLQEFYTAPVTHATGTQSLATLLPDMFVPRIGTTIPEATVKVYDVRDSIPRPASERQYDVTGTTPGAAFPAEVALVGSFYATRNLPRQRGRIYIGPLKAFAGVTGTLGESRPSPALRNTLAACMERLAGSGDGLLWCVLSRAQAGIFDFQRVTAGWVDDAWDTQRRRGNSETMRTPWAAASP